MNVNDKLGQSISITHWITCDWASFCWRKVLLHQKAGNFLTTWVLADYWRTASCSLSFVFCHFSFHLYILIHAFVLDNKSVFSAW
jgi:hypothetical protein